MSLFHVLAVLAAALAAVAAATPDHAVGLCETEYYQAMNRTRTGDDPCPHLAAFSKCLDLATAGVNGTEDTRLRATVDWEPISARSGCDLTEARKAGPHIASDDGFLRMVVHEDKDVVVQRHRRAETVSVFAMHGGLMNLEGRISALEGRLATELSAAVGQAKTEFAAVSSALQNTIGTMLGTQTQALQSDVATMLNDKEALLSGLIAETYANVSTNRAEMSALNRDVEKKLASVVASVEKKLDSVVASVEQKLDSTVTSVNLKLDVVSANALKAVADMDKKITESLQPKIDAAVAAASRILTDTNSGLCGASMLGAIRYNTNSGGIQFCNTLNVWADIVEKGSAAIPGGSCEEFKTSQPGYKYILANGQAVKTWCEGGFALVAVVRVGDCIDHLNRASVRFSAGSGFGKDTGNTAKWSDSMMNSYRTSSPYRGNYAWRMQAMNGCMGGYLYCHSDCNFNAEASVYTSRCSYCAQSDGGGFSQGSPNHGTRGMGHHHWYSNWYAWSRHPESGRCANRGFRSDACGESNGYLWLR